MIFFVFFFLFWSSIPISNEENVSTWRTRIMGLFKLGGVKEQINSGEPALEESNNTILCAIIIAKLSPATHSNVSSNIQLILENSLRYVGINMPLSYNLLNRLPSSMKNIKQTITHSKNSDDIKPKILLDHLEIHLNELKVAATSHKLDSVTMFTESDKKCSPGKHSPRADHPGEKCWFDANKANAPHHTHLSQAESLH
ncbi:hypothetical protein VP01_4277g3 [Puccinia sorghi]|uniref:Uncharacterized protein n=1 Tax=Puccinia sorghi TaxID=27349 RepID=A0A0L6UQ99_9BASI|nr:hypothetical protein VP01_4277g3 [Puccinia sorghi]